MQELNKFYCDEGPERCGFVLKSGEIVEVQNHAHEPENGFEIAGIDTLKYLYDAEATWHTHPNKDANLSLGDYDGFWNLRRLNHFIIGNDGVRRYYFEKDLLLCSDQ